MHHHHKAHPQAKKGQAKSFAPQSSDRQGPKKKCTRCGQTPSHNRESCPTHDAICHRCKNRGHFKSQCRERACQTVCWPGINRELEELALSCPQCCQERKQSTTPLIPSQFLKLSWETVGMDLFQWKGRTYLLVVDYFSHFIEIAHLKSESSEEVIRQLKKIFACHGIPNIVISDNGPQFSSREFVLFSNSYHFTHRTSNPKHPQANAEAERAVRTIKCLLKKAEDPLLALLSYRATPLRNGYSPAELLMGRKLRTTVPTILELLRPKVPNYSQLAAKEADYREKQKTTFDIRHRASEPRVLTQGESVWVPDMKTQGTVESQISSRSYIVSTPRGSLRRNREQLRPTPNIPALEDSTDVVPERDSVSPPTSVSASTTAQPPAASANAAYRTRSGRVSVAPDRYRPT